MKERKVLGLAVDTLSLDHGPSKDFKVHYAWLPSGRWGLENVANLDKVPAVRRDAGGGAGEGEGRHRRAGAPDRAGLTRKSGRCCPRGDIVSDQRAVGRRQVPGGRVVRVARCQGWLVVERRSR